MLGPAVTGTTNVLKAASAANVRRVVVVSSIVAVEISPKDWPEGKIRDESCWSDKEFCRSIEVTFTANFCIRVRTAKICFFYLDKLQDLLSRFAAMCTPELVPGRQDHLRRGGARIRAANWARRGDYQSRVGVRPPAAADG